MKYTFLIIILISSCILVSIICFILSPKKELYTNIKIKKYIEKLYQNIKNSPIPANAKNASYIPTLADVDKNLFGISIHFVNGDKIELGDYEYPFAIESISKLPTMMLVAEQEGIDNIKLLIGDSPSNFSFNSMIATDLPLETDACKIFSNSKDKTCDMGTINSFDNAGAMATTSLIKGNNKKEIFDSIINYIKKLTDNNTISVNKKVYQSELATNYRNQSLAFLLRNYNRFYNFINVTNKECINWLVKNKSNLEPPTDCKRNLTVKDIVNVYTKQCSINITAQDLGKIGLLLANNGKNLKKSSNY